MKDACKWRQTRLNEVEHIVDGGLVGHVEGAAFDTGAEPPHSLQAIAAVLSHGAASTAEDDRARPLLDEPFRRCEAESTETTRDEISPVRAKQLRLRGGVARRVVRREVQGESAVLDRRAEPCRVGHD